MNEEFTTYDLENDDYLLNTEEDDYKNLMIRLKDISKSISLIEKKYLDNFIENKIIICTENAKKKTNYRNEKQRPNKENFKTKLAIRKALRHEATHAIQKCNNNKTVGDIKDLDAKLHQSKRRSLEFSTSNFSGTYAKEVEAYILEDKPKKVKNMIKKYCL